MKIKYAIVITATKEFKTTIIGTMDNINELDQWKDHISNYLNTGWVVKFRIIEK